METTDVAIIGGGCSGVLVAANLILHSTRGLRVSLIEKREALGKGVAYSTQCLEHLLNVPAQNMSGFVENPNHLRNWLESKKLDSGPWRFVPRKIYGDYLAFCLEEAHQKKRPDVTLEVIQSECQAIQKQRERFIVELTDGRTLDAANVVLASGLYFHDNSQRIIKNPWAVDFKNLPKDSSIAIVGSGLSMVDMVLLLKENQWRGRVTVFAKNGSLPLSHNPESFVNKMSIDWNAMGSMGEIFREFRKRLTLISSQNFVWQSLVDSFRPHTQNIWQRLSEKEKTRFLRHLQGIWDHHRHRIASEVAVTMQKLLGEGFFDLKKATVVSIEENSQEVCVNYKSQGELKTERFDFSISCMGLEGNPLRVPTAMMRSALSQGIVIPGVLGRGLLATRKGQLIDREGKTQTGFFALGFLQQGNLYESIAVPEIRDQAKTIANEILLNLAI